MFKYICFAIGIAVFVGFMSLVGNPHVVETVIGLCLGSAAGLWIYFKFRKKINEFWDKEKDFWTGFK